MRQRSWDNPESGFTDAAPYVFSFPVGATISEPGPRRLHVDADNDPSRTVIVERCGRARPLLRRDCFRARFECGLPAIAAGVVAWREGGRLRAFLPRARRLLSWPLMSHARFALTAHRVWLVKAGRLLSARV